MKFCLALVLIVVTLPSMSQVSQRTSIKGNTVINVVTDNTTAIATGENNVARNKIGVIQRDKKGDTRISVNASNVTTVTGGRNKKACTNIGSIVSDECK